MAGYVFVKGLLPQIMDMSARAGLVILMVLLMRIPLRRAPRVFCYALWGVVLLRLLCPVSFSSPFSLFENPAGADGACV